MVVLPGAGFCPRPRPLEHARQGYLAIDIQVHGQDVDQPEYESLPGHNGDAVFAPPESYCYFNTYRRAVRAVDYLLSRPDVDGSRVVLVGGSQGGRLGLVVAGLHDQVAAAVTSVAHFSNQPHLRWIEHCDAASDHGMTLPGSPPAGGDLKSRCLAYFDPMNFAPDISCPILMNSGFIDPVSPPYSVWAAYLRLNGTDKTMVPVCGHGHDAHCPEFDRRAWRWLDKRLAAPETAV